MTTSAKAVRFDADSLWVDLSDGRIIAVPLAWFPRLLHASEEQRQNVEFSRSGDALGGARRRHLGGRPVGWCRRPDEIAACLGLTRAR